MNTKVARIREYVETIAIPLAVEALVVAAAFAAAFIWCSIGSGRI